MEAGRVVALVLLIVVASSSTTAHAASSSPRASINGSSTGDLRDELNHLRKELSNDQSTRCANYRKLNGTLLERVIAAVLRDQYVNLGLEMVQFSDLLHKKLNSDQNHQDDELVLSLLRNYMSINRALAEIGLIIPINKQVPSTTMTRDGSEAFLIRKVSRRELRSAMIREKLTNTSLRVNSSSSTVYPEWWNIQRDWYDGRSSALVWPNVDRALAPAVVLHKYCYNYSSGASGGGGPKRQARWQAVLVIRTKAYSVAKTVSMFYVAIPFSSIDLNQCEDSPHEMLRSTHGCINSTSCLFIPGGGFELGHYECCCQAASATNVSSPSPILYYASSSSNSRRDKSSRQWNHRANYRHCIDGRLVEQALNLSLTFPGRCNEYYESDMDLRRALLAINIICALAAVALIFVVTTQRKVKDWGARGWALMEFWLIGAILIYFIVILEYFQPSTSTCCLIPWCRELGFALFYGAVVLKIHRNLFEHGVRKANYVFIKEKDLLKYLLCIVAFTLVGLLAWTVTAMQAVSVSLSPFSSTPTSAVVSRGRSGLGDAYLICTFFHWNLIWHSLEFGFLSYGAYLSWRARTTNWNERHQFAAAVALEMVVSMNMIVIKKHIWLDSSPDTQLLLSFFHAHFTITVVVVTIMATKLYYARLAPAARDHSTASSGANRMHPSLARLRDNLMNGTVDFAEMPIGELNPEDIRAELKRVYTQLRMYKLTNLYMDNPHISKRKGGKKTSNKQTNRRLSIPTVPSKTSHKELTRATNQVEIDERSSLTKAAALEDEQASMGGGGGSNQDLTVHTSTQNAYYSKPSCSSSLNSSKCTAANKSKLDSNPSVCI